MLIYDAARVLKFGGQISYHNSEKLKLYLRGDFTNYQMDNEQEAWNRPSTEITFGGTYDIADKLIFRADLFYVGKRNSKSLLPVEGVVESDGIYKVELPAYFDMNLGAEYRYTDRLSVFFNVNNVATRKYTKWDNYPVQSLNVLGGATFRF